ncbi:MAG: DUF6600 domain-containing protein [Acidobacteriota bacterium]
MSRYRGFFCWIALLLVLLANAPTSWAGSKDTLDLRKTRIARISLLEGDVSLQHSVDEEWETAVVNLPINTGDLIYAGSSSRLELELLGLFIRLSEITSLEVLELSEKRYRFDMTVGTATFSLREGLVDEIEISTPQTAIVLKKTGVYRVNVLAGGDVEVIVHKGEAELFTRTGQFILQQDRHAILRAVDPPDVEISANIMIDYWDNWNQEREQLALNNSRSRSYVDHNAYGVSDLDLYGSWHNVSSYGWVWRPHNVAANWAPYRLGRWVYYPNWGWTWVSQEPWGWLPYHYGYWTFLSNVGWVWVPYQVSWYWSPARVNWYYVNWNERNYVCWRPAQNNWQTPNAPPNPQPLSPIGVGQPLDHGRGGERRHSDRPDISPGGVRPDQLDDGTTVLDEADFIRGGLGESPVRDIADRLRGLRRIDPDQLPVRPARSSRIASDQPPRQLPSEDFIKRPVIVRGGDSIPIGAKPRREREIVGPGRTPNHPTGNSADAHPDQRSGRSDRIAKPVDRLPARPIGEQQRGTLIPISPTPTESPAKGVDRGNKPFDRQPPKVDPQPRRDPPPRHDSPPKPQPPTPAPKSHDISPPRDRSPNSGNVGRGGKGQNF